MYNIMYDLIYEEGMTWGEWINTEYNIHPTTNTTPWLVQLGLSPMIFDRDGALMLSVDGVATRLDDDIIENEKYELSYLN